MTIKYKLANDPITGQVSCVHKTETGKTNTITFPLIEGNRHYDEYKIWLDAGNTPEAAD